MPQERDHPYPHPTAADVEAAPGDRETKAARNIVSRHIPGIPKRGYMLGDSDSAPILQGVRDLTAETYKLVDLIDEANINGKPAELPTVEEWGKIIDQNAEIVALMEDHRCPAAPADE